MLDYIVIRVVEFSEESPFEIVSDRYFVVPVSQLVTTRQSLVGG
jgi:hypothetical protein